MIDIDEPTTLEGVGTVTFTVSLSHQSGLPVTVELDRDRGDRDQRAGASSTQTALRLVRSHWTRPETITITVNDDATFEHDETMALNLANAVDPPIGDTQGIGTIANDDAAPGLSVAATPRSPRGTPVSGR